MKTLTQLLQERAELVKAQAALVETAKAENRDLTEEEERDFESYEQQIAALDDEIERAKKRESRQAKVAERMAGLSKPAVEPVRPMNLYGGPVQKDKLDDGGFRNLGEFIMAVRFGDKRGRLEERPMGENGGFEVPPAFKAAIMPSRFRNEWTMGTGEEGGFAVPIQRRDQILRLPAEGAIVRPRAQVIPAGDPPDSAITIPVFRQGADGAFGGVEVDWIGEGATKPETDGKLDELQLEPHEVAAHTTVTDKLLRNWQAASVFIENLLRAAVDNAEDLAFLTGSGVGKPIGVTESDGMIAVNRGTASEIHYDDIAAMSAKLLPQSSGAAVWVAHQTTIPQLLTLQDPGGRFIFIQGDATRGIPATLDGKPVIFTGKTASIGNKNDLMLIDFSYYLIKDGSGPFVAASEHVHFRQNKTVIKIFWNVDGKSWVKDPLTLEDGSTQVSPYVTLDVPSGG